MTEQIVATVDDEDVDLSKQVPNLLARVQQQEQLITHLQIERRRSDEAWRKMRSDYMALTSHSARKTGRLGQMIDDYRRTLMDVTEFMSSLLDDIVEDASADSKYIDEMSARRADLISRVKQVTGVLRHEARVAKKKASLERRAASCGLTTEQFVEARKPRTTPPIAAVDQPEAPSPHATQEFQSQTAPSPNVQMLTSFEDGKTA